MLIDTHCHLDFKDFDLDRDAVIDRARAAGVRYIINVGSSLEGSVRSCELAGRYEMVYSSVGVHPHDANTVDDEAMAKIKKLASSEKVAAIGEIGLDYYRNLSPKDKQIEVFKQFIRLAKELDLPIIIHSRDAGSEVLDILKDEAVSPIKGVMHCFSGDSGFLKGCLDLGLYVSFTCNLTFKNAKGLKALAREAPAERLLLETDAPFLAPQDLRGKRNEPAYIVRLAEELAAIKGLAAEDIARITSHNASRLFGLPCEDGDVAKIVYAIRDSLYLNITNRCTSDCSFCVRNFTDYVKGHNLRLAQEPGAEAILEAIGDPAGFKEIVFCGYGEPTLRLDVVKSVARKMKERGAKVRLVTNGHGDLINSRPIAEELKGLMDRVSVSLNVDSREKYNDICKPNFGPETYDAVLKFASSCVASGIETEITCLQMPGVDMDKCRAAASSIGASFRVRELDVVG